MPSREITTQRNPDAQSGVDIDTMLNDKKFLEALAEQTKIQPEKMDLADENTELKEKYKAFQESKKVSKDLIKLCREQITKDFEISLDEKDFDGIEKYINGQVFENPENILKLREQIEEFKTAPDRIRDKENKLAELTGGQESNVTGRLEDIKQRMLEKKDKKELEKGEEKEEAKKAWFFKERKKEKVEEKFKDIIKELDDEITKITDKIRDIKDVSGTREEVNVNFQGARSEIFEKIIPIKGIMEKAKLKVQDKYQKLSEGELEDVEKARQYERHIKEVAGKKNEGIGLDALENFKLDKTGKQEDEKFLDLRLESTISKELKRRINETAIGLKPLDSLENKLKDLLTKQELGSKGREETREFLVDTLDKQIKEQTSGALRAKNILLLRIKSKLDKGDYENSKRVA